jgi:hypothetical protein
VIGEPSETSATSSPTWEEVLSAFEATAVQAEVLLAAGKPLSAGELAMPAIDPVQLAMPPIPAELQPRAMLVGMRQAELIAQLQRAMVGVRQQIQLTDGTSVARPVYVDRSA